MKITLLVIGKTSEKYLIDGVALFCKRLLKYANFIIIEQTIPAKYQELPPAAPRQKETEVIFQFIEKSDFSVLLDETRRTFPSIEFSDFTIRKLNQSTRNLLSVVGGA